MKKTLIKIRKQWQFHCMLVPGMIILFLFSYIPLYGVIIAFEDYNVTTGFHSKWVGWNNFRFLFAQPNFVRTIWNTLYIAGFKLILGIIVPVTVALLLNEVGNQKIKRVFQTMVYLPHFISWVILAGIMTNLLSMDGIVNRLLGMVGIGSINFLASPSIFPWTIILSSVWQNFGYGTIVYLATLTGIDPQLYESAAIDGAKRWKQTIYITLPMLMPMIVLMTVLALGGVLNAGFDQIYNMYNPVVYRTGDVIDTYVYRLGIEQAQYSIGTAVGLFKSLVSIVMIGISYFLADKLAGYRIL